jgi:hypothetical protein
MLTRYYTASPLYTRACELTSKAEATEKTERGNVGKAPKNANADATPCCALIRVDRAVHADSLTELLSRKTEASSWERYAAQMSRMTVHKMRRRPGGPFSPAAASSTTHPAPSNSTASSRICDVSSTGYAKAKESASSSLPQNNVRTYIIKILILVPTILAITRLRILPRHLLLLNRRMMHRPLHSKLII